MNKLAEGDLVCMTVIADRKKKEPLLKALKKNDGKLINVEFGYGSAHVSSLSEMFGFTPENKKVFITCLMRNDASIRMLEILNEDFKFNEQNTGIAYTIALDRLSF